MNWNALEAIHDTALVQAVRLRVLSGASPQIDMTNFIGPDHAAEHVSALFEALVANDVLEKQVITLCPRCTHALEETDLRQGLCPSCELDFAETGDTPVEQVVFLVTDVERSREIPWLIAIHGFNTHGEWQENFSWLLATRFKHRAPALMHKFPFLSWGVLLRWKHQQLAGKLDQRLRAAMERARESGIDEPPDIIAHSFGSLLFARLLDRPESADLKFGRVILAGAIVRPDYDWSAHVRAGRIDAVLNHCSAKDFVVNWAQWFIPDSGPSGRVGFNDPKVLNYRESDFDHGTHFEPEIMVGSLQDDGLWDRFFSLPKSSLEQCIISYHPRTRWHAAPSVLTKTTRGLTTVVVALLAVLALITILTGAYVMLVHIV
jgi:hypothetical protein